MPPWLAPVQVAIANISEGQADYAEAVVQTLKKQGFRAEADLRNEKITYKIRQLSLQKVPYILVVGDKERQAGTVAVRARGGVDLGVMSLSDFAERLSTDVRERRNVAGAA
jgi:threonyl-tRNA synthetase